MKKNLSYQEELRQICQKLKRSFSIRINAISAIQTSHYINKLVALNKKTKNEHIDEIINAIGNIKLAYLKYCNENNYIADPYVNRKIKDKYIKLSQKAMKIKTKGKNIKNNPEHMEIEYSSEKGSYTVIYENNGKIYNAKQYRVQNIKNLDYKREYMLKKLTRLNYGINIFDELQVKKSKFYKVNPDILHILISEGKLDYAKMYIKEVVGGETLHHPFNIKYRLNRNLNLGVFSREENENMKKMARLDRLANEIVIIGKKSKKKIIKPSEQKRKLDVIDSIKRSIRFKNAKNSIDQVKPAKLQKSIVEVYEDEERSKKITSILQKKKNRVTTASGCKIYNVDRRNTTSESEEIANCVIYDISNVRKVASRER